MIEIRRTFNKDRGFKLVEPLNGYTFTPETNAHTFFIECVDKVNGLETVVPFEAGSTVSARFLKTDHVTELVEGSLNTDGAAVVTLPSECYSVPGRFLLTILVTTGSTTICVYAATGTVIAADSSTVNVSENASREIDEKIAELNAAAAQVNSAISAGSAKITEINQAAAAARASIPQDYTALSNSVGDLKSILTANDIVTGALTPTVFSNCSIYSNGAIIQSSGFNVYLYAITGIERIRVDGGSIYAFYENTPTVNVTPSIDAMRHIRTLSGAELKAPTGANYIAIRHTEAPSVTNIDNLKRTVEDLEYIKSFNTKTIMFSESGVYINQNGTETQSAEYKSTDYVPAVGGSVFTIHAYYSGDARFASYDANKNLVEVWANTDSVGALVTYNLQPSVCYVRWTLNTNYEYSLDAYTAYITNTIDDLIDDLKAVEKNLIDDLEAVEQNVEQNVVYKGNPTISYTDGQYLALDGTLVTGQASVFKTTGFIELQDTDVLVNIPATNFTTNPYILMVAYFSAQNNSSFISGISANGQPILSLIPKGAKYVVFGSNTSTAGTYTALNADIEIQGTLRRDGDKVEFICPESYDLIVGDTFELFYKGIISSFDPDAYLVTASCSIGANYKKRFIVTPTTAGTYALSLNLYDTKGNILDTKTINLIVHAAPSSPGTNKNVLCVGDSLTQDGVWVAELYRRLNQSGGTPSGFNLSNITFIGNREHNNAKYEGYGGYTFARYNAESVDAYSKTITCSHDKDSSDQHSIYQASNGSRWKLETIDSTSITIINVWGDVSGFPASGTLTWVSGGINHSSITYTASANAAGNPFWDSTAGKVDFAKYATEQGASSIDFVYVLLGWNNWSSSLSTIKQAAQTFIDNMHTSFQNAKIVLMGLQIPSRDGLAVNYGAYSGNISDYLKMSEYVHNLDTVYDKLADENTNVYHMNLSGQFDTEHNMPQSTRPVNTRNSETEIYQTNGIHPAGSGELQIADAATRHFVGLLS